MVAENLEMVCMGANIEVNTLLHSVGPVYHKSLVKVFSWWNGLPEQVKLKKEARYSQGNEKGFHVQPE
jgi:hypothetical protein